MQSLPKNINNLIEEFTKLPGIGPKSAARIVFFLLKAPREFTDSLTGSLSDAKFKVKICSKCFNFADNDLCKICMDDSRKVNQIMLVEDALDLVAIEKSGVFHGVYHVLGGLLSPMNGIGPDEIRIDQLIERLEMIPGEIELIIGVNPTMEGESTALYVQNEIEQKKKLAKRVRLTRLARGLASGADIDYADEITIRKAYEGRDKL